MKKIKLSQGQFALVDNEDFDWINQWRWHAHKGGSTFYATRYQYGRDKNGKTSRMIRMHRLIMKTPDDLQVDHKNGNGLDNQRENLRNVTPTVNQWNRRKARNTTSRFIGVIWNKRIKEWQGHIMIKGKNKYLGRFKTEEEARDAYLIAKSKRENGTL